MLLEVPMTLQLFLQHSIVAQGAATVKAAVPAGAAAETFRLADGTESAFMWLQVSFYHRNVARQQQQMQQWLQKRRQENATRRLAGEEPLPEEDPALFKPIPEPSPLDVYLINNQVGLPQCS